MFALIGLLFALSGLYLVLTGSRDTGKRCAYVALVFTALALVSTVIGFVGTLALLVLFGIGMLGFKFATSK